MAVATTVLSSHFLYQTTIVMLRMYASFLWAQLVVIWIIAKWTPSVLSSLWVMTIRFLPCFMSCSYVSGAISYVSTVGELWMISFCQWKVSIVIGIAGTALVVVFDHFDNFDNFEKRWERAVAHHRVRRGENRRVRVETTQAETDNAEGMLPMPGAYDYGKAYKLNYQADENKE